MKAYKTFIVKRDGVLRSIFHFFDFHDGENVYKEKTRGFLSWATKKQAERYRETLVAIHFSEVIVKEIEIKKEDIIKEEKERLYTKDGQKKLKIKNPYGIAIYSTKIYI
jgi:hypothetical protein